MISIEKSYIMEDSNKIFLDTNILVYATLEDFDSEKHYQVINMLDDLVIKERKFVISTQILREFFAVATNPKYLRSPLSFIEVNKQIEFFQSSFELVLIDSEVISILLDLCMKYRIIGKKAYDTTITATMIKYSIKNLLTYNIKDFKKFEEINLIDNLLK